MILNRRTLLLAGLTVPVMAKAQTAPMSVLASFSILADMAQQLGGTDVGVTSLIGRDQDAHSFQPSPADARKVAGAKVILANGLGFEPFLERMIKSAGGVRPTILTTAITPLKLDKAQGHSHDHGPSSDPHAWQSVPNAKLYAAAITEAFRTADPARAAAYTERLAAYQQQLDALDAEIRKGLATLPAERRVLTTTHDAFGYFAREYGLSVQAVQGISSESEPSAADMARIIRRLKTLKAPAVFLENVTDPRRLDQIARETGAKIGGTLYSDALSVANGPAPTYIDMMRHNLSEIVKALAPQS